MTDDQEVYNTKGKSPGSSGNSTSSDDDSGQSDSIPPPELNATKDSIDTFKQESTVHKQPSNSPLATTAPGLSDDSQIKVYSYAMDPRYRHKLHMYRRSLKSRLQTLTNKTNP
ncbi:MAG: hypothetical protein PsegKO_25450 [Pseudohongiellaceae bacterium]|jgi:hypothetical protein